MLRVSADDGDGTVMHNNALSVIAGVVIVLAVIGLSGYIVRQIGATAPAVAVAALAGLASVLAAVPPVIRAVRGK